MQVFSTKFWDDVIWIAHVWKCIIMGLQFFLIRTTVDFFMCEKSVSNGFHCFNIKLIHITFASLLVSDIVAILIIKDRVSFIVRIVLQKKES